MGKPKPNGQAKKPAPGTATGVPTKPILSHEPSAAAVAATESRPVEHQNHQQPQQSGLETPPTGLSNGAAASSLPQEQEQEQEKSQQKETSTTLEATPAAIGEELR